VRGGITRSLNDQLRKREKEGKKRRRRDKEEVETSNSPTSKRMRARSEIEEVGATRKRKSPESRGKEGMKNVKASEGGGYQIEISETPGSS